MSNTALHRGPSPYSVMESTPMLIKTKNQLIPDVFSRQFEFISPLLLEECVIRLQSKAEPWRLLRFKNPLHVKVSPVNEGVYQFKIQRDAGRNLNVEVVGTLQQLEDETTLISGIGRISRSTFIVFLVISSIQIPIFGSLFGFGFFGYLFVPLLLIFWVSCYAERQRLIAILPNTLGVLGTLKKKRSSGQEIAYRPSSFDRLEELASYALLLVFALIFWNMWRSTGIT